MLKGMTERSDPAKVRFNTEVPSDASEKAKQGAAEHKDENLTPVQQKAALLAAKAELRGGDDPEPTDEDA